MIVSPRPHLQYSKEARVKTEFFSNCVAEKIRRKDLEVAQALEEKHRLLAEYYHLPFDEAALASSESEESTGGASSAAERDARDVLLAALVLQGQYL